MKKIIRTVTYFSDNPNSNVVNKIQDIKSQLLSMGFEIQTTRLVSNKLSLLELDKTFIHQDLLTSIGEVTEIDKKLLDELNTSQKTSLNYNTTNKELTLSDVEILFNIIESAPSKTFNFAYTFNNNDSSPFFPSAKFHKNGFSIGLQSTNLVEGCTNIDEWLESQKNVWHEIFKKFGNDKGFLGIDSSVAPLLDGTSSLINMIKLIHGTFSRSILTDTYTKITKFIKTQNPKPVGLCGLMIPCLEDFELADEYEAGSFDLKTNLFLSLHSGLGIDTYPIGINEDKYKILDVLKLVQALSKKYTKPLSVRFVSDGISKIGDKTDFKNPYLKDVIIRAI